MKKLILISKESSRWYSEFLYEKREYFLTTNWDIASQSHNISYSNFEKKLRAILFKVSKEYRDEFNNL